MTQALLVGLAVIFCDFVETWFSYPMTTRPLIVGTVIGIVLGDITTGIVVGASLELVFMGVGDRRYGAAGCGSGYRSWNSLCDYLGTGC